MAPVRPRPLSPHLSIFRWRAAMAVSIVHRVTGNGLATVGVMIFLWWLVAAASGQEAYASFYMVASHPLTVVVWIGLTWFFFQHLASGVRHLIMDTGAGYDPPTARASSIAAFGTAVVLTALTWGFILFGRV